MVKFSNHSNHSRSHSEWNVTKIRKFTLVMNVEDLRDFCLTLEMTAEAVPFEDAKFNNKPSYANLVSYSIGGKWYCIVDIEKKYFNVKSETDIILELIDRYTGAFPAYHMNKNYWVSISLESDIPDDLQRSLISASYRNVLMKFTKKKRAELGI